MTGDFDGDTFLASRDNRRLTGQLKRVKDLMLDGEWRSLKQIANVVGGSEAGVSARLRDLRKIKFGGLDIERRNAGGGIWFYRMARTE